jgi:hypothetical protein
MLSQKLVVEMFNKLNSSGEVKASSDKNDGKNDKKKDSDLWYKCVTKKKK